MRKVILPFVLLVSTLAFAQERLVPGIVNNGKNYGVVYTLPESQIVIKIKVKKDTYTPGRFSNYAEQYLQDKNVSSDPSTFWTITDIQVNDSGVPDKSQYYFIEMKEKTVAPFVELTSGGIIKSINAPYTTNKTAEKKQDTDSATIADNKTKTSATPIKKMKPEDYFTEEILMASSTAKRAELVAKEIYAIRDSKSNLIRGQADSMPNDGLQMQIMIDNLNAQEEVLSSLFKGTITNEEKTYTFVITPDKEISHQIVFRFSKTFGVVASDDLSGSPYYFSLKDLHNLKTPDTKENVKEKRKGIAYNLTGNGLVTLSDGEKTIFENKIPITQFGTKEYLSPVLFKKDTGLKVFFNPNTGELLKVHQTKN